MMVLLMVLSGLCWDPSENATGYRVYSRIEPICIVGEPEEWALRCDTAGTCPDVGPTPEAWDRIFRMSEHPCLDFECVCVDFTSGDPAPAHIEFYAISAYNAAGESGHGPKPDTAPGLVPCP